MNQFNNNRLVYSVSQQTNFPGDYQAGLAEIYSDDRIINNPANIDHSRFHENLAFHLSDATLQSIGNSLSDAIQNDDNARQKYLQTITEYVNYCGIGIDKARVSQSNRNLDIYGPTLLKLVLMNASKLHSNLFPVNNLIVCDVYGQTSQKIEDQALAMADFSNYMISEVMTGYRDDKRQGLTSMVGTGQFFSKVVLDRSKNKPTANWIRTEDIIIDPNATSIYDAERVTHQYFVNPREANEKIRRGEWIDVSLEQYDLSNTVVKKKTMDKVGIIPNQDDSNIQFCIHECQTYYDLKDIENKNRLYARSGRQLPYIIGKDKESNNIVGVWRNWNPNDPLCRPIHRITQYKYFPGEGPYGYGMAHFAIGLAKCETQVLQQLLKAGELSNNPALLQSSTMKNEKSQIYADAGAINQINTFGKNIQDALLPMPFKEPSSAYMSLLTDIISPAMADISGVMNFSPEDMPANATATLVSAIVNTSHILEDSIMGGLYDSFASELKLLFNVFNEWLPYSPFPFAVPGGSKSIAKEDFSPCVQIRPSIDPNASSNMQQMALGEAILDLSMKNPDLYDMREVNKLLLKSLKIKDVDSLLIPVQKKQPPVPMLDFVSENSRVLLGEPIQVYPTQDHAAHEIGHDDMIQRLQADTTTDNTDKINVLTSHNNEHKSYNYLAQVQALMGKDLPPESEISSLSDKVQNKISVLAAQAIQQQQEQNAKDNPPPVDPNAVMMKELGIKEQEIALAKMKLEQETQITMTKMQNEKEQQGIENQIKMKELEISQNKLLFEGEKIRLLKEEHQLKTQEKMADIELQREKMNLDSETKSYAATLKVETDSKNANSKLELEKDKIDLESEAKAYDSTLDYEAKNKEEGIANINK